MTSSSLNKMAGDAVHRGNEERLEGQVASRFYILFRTEQDSALFDETNGRKSIFQDISTLVPSRLSNQRTPS